MRQLLTSAKTLILSAATAAGTGAVTGTTFDTQGYEDVTILVHVGTITATGTVTLKAQGGSAANGSDKADIEGASAVATDADGSKILALEIHRPKQRYITPIITRATANGAILSVIGILHGASNVPVEQTDISHKVAVNAPDLA